MNALRLVDRGADLHQGEGVADLRHLQAADEEGRAGLRTLPRGGGNGVGQTDVIGAEGVGRTYTLGVDWFTSIPVRRDEYPELANYARRRGCETHQDSAYWPQRLSDQLAQAHLWGSKVPVIYSAATLDGLAPDQHPEKIKKFVSSDLLTMLLVGNVGGGKTHAAYAALLEVQVQHFLQHGEFLLYDQAPLVWSVPRLLEALRPSSRHDSEWVYQEVTHRPFVVLDDVGALRATDFAVEMLFSILDERVTHGLRQIVTSNHSAKALVEQWGEPIVDRLVYRAGTLEYPMKSRRVPIRL